MGKRKNILGKSLSSILKEEITPDKILANSKMRGDKYSVKVRKTLYSEYLKDEESLVKEVVDKYL